MTNTQQTNQNCQLLSAKALARILSTSVRTIWRYAGSGRLPANLKIAGSVRWRQSDIEKWVKMGCPDRKEFEQFEGMVQ